MLVTLPCACGTQPAVSPPQPAVGVHDTHSRTWCWACMHACTRGQALLPASGGRVAALASKHRTNAYRIRVCSYCAPTTHSHAWTPACCCCCTCHLRHLQAGALVAGGGASSPGRPPLGGVSSLRVRGRPGPHAGSGSGGGGGPSLHPHHPHAMSPLQPSASASAPALGSAPGGLGSPAGAPHQQQQHGQVQAQAGGQGHAEEEELIEEADRMACAEVVAEGWAVVWEMVTGEGCGGGGRGCAHCRHLLCWAYGRRGERPSCCVGVGGTFGCGAAVQPARRTPCPAWLAVCARVPACACAHARVCERAQAHPSGQEAGLLHCTCGITVNPTLLRVSRQRPP